MQPAVLQLALQNEQLQIPSTDDEASITAVCEALVAALPAVELAADQTSQVQTAQHLCTALLTLLQLLNHAAIAEGFHSSEYAKQLLFRALLVSANSADLSKEQVAAFDVSQIVQCARAGSGPARSHALELLSQLASKHGQQVVEQAMPLFTLSLESGENEATYTVLHRALAAIEPAACSSDQMRPEQVVTLFLDSLGSVLTAHYSLLPLTTYCYYSYSVLPLIAHYVDSPLPRSIFSMLVVAGAFTSARRFVRLVGACARDF